MVSKSEILLALEAGESTGAIAKRFGISQHRVMAIKRFDFRPPAEVRDANASLDDPAWRGLCMYHRALADACTARATHRKGAWQACDKHRLPRDPHKVP